MPQRRQPRTAFVTSRKSRLPSVGFPSSTSPVVRHRRPPRPLHCFRCLFAHNRIVVVISLAHLIFLPRRPCHSDPIPTPGRRPIACSLVASSRIVPTIACPNAQKHAELHRTQLITRASLSCSAPSHRLSHPHSRQPLEPRPASRPRRRRSPSTWRPPPSSAPRPSSFPRIASGPAVCPSARVRLPPARTAPTGRAPSSVQPRRPSVANTGACPPYNRSFTPR